MFEIGNTLREARVRRKLTLQQAEEDTKVRVKYIQAMENEEFDTMPSSAYVMGFLRTYSTYLGLDADVILSEYRSRFGPHEDHEPFGGSSALKPRHHRKRNTLAFVAVVCLLMVALLYVLGVSDSSRNGDEGPAPIASGSPSLSSKPKSSTSPRPGGVTLVVTADKAATFLEVRRDGDDGKLLYLRELPQGVSKSFSDPEALYVALKQPSDVTLAVNGDQAKRPAETVATSYVITASGMVKK